MITPDWETADGTVRLWCRDCLDVLPTLEADAVVTDPPYGIGHKHSGLGATPEGRTSLRRFSCDITGDDEWFDPTPLLDWPCVLFGADHYCDKLTPDGTFHWWDKAYKGGPADSFSDAEVFWTSWQCKRQVVRYLWKGVCQDGEKSSRKYHPSQKPIAVMLRCVGMADGIILDPFMGSGTTGVACVRTGRRFLGIEKEAKYFEIAVKRIEAELNRAPLFDAKPQIVQQQFIQ